MFFVDRQYDNLALMYIVFSTNWISLVMDDFKISKLDRFRFDFLKKI